MGRKLEDVIRKMEADINSFYYEKDSILPPIRNLAERYKVSRNTVFLGLKALAKEGKLKLDKKKGYRLNIAPVLSSSSSLIAYIAFDFRIAKTQNMFFPMLLDNLMYYGDRCGFSVINISTFQKSYQEIINELKRLNVAGVIISTYYHEFMDELKKHNFPLLMVDTYIQNMNIASILQDNFIGGLLAADWVYKQKLDEIVWVGSFNISLHSLERYGGFVAGLALHQMTLKPENIIDFDDKHISKPEEEKRLVDCFSRCRTPFVIVSLWSTFSVYVYQLSKKLGLVYGKDFFIVGWCMQESFDYQFKDKFLENERPVYITWSVKDLAQMAIGYFQERSNNLPLNVYRKNVPVTLIDSVV